MNAQLGQQVTLEGIAEARKLGAVLRGSDFDVWIDQLQDWPRDYVGQRVRVTGILDERHDLPVFIQKPESRSLAESRCLKARTCAKPAGDMFFATQDGA
jgi:hypothetical protein